MWAAEFIRAIRNEHTPRVVASEALEAIAQALPESAAEMLGEGVLGLIKLAMETHAGAADVQCAACSALAAIAHDSPENAAEMLGEGVFGVIKLAMETHAGAAD